MLVLKEEGCGAAEILAVPAIPRFASDFLLSMPVFFLILPENDRERLVMRKHPSVKGQIVDSRAWESRSPRRWGWDVAWRWGYCLGSLGRQELVSSGSGSPVRPVHPVPPPI